MYGPNFMTIHPIVDETLHSKQVNHGRSTKSLGHIVCEPMGVPVQNFVPIHLADVEIFHRISEKSDLITLITEMHLDTVSPLHSLSTRGH